MSSGKSGIATLLGLRGDKPEVPPFIPIDPTAEQRDTIAGNLANLPEAERLAGKTNEATARQFMEMMERLIPGFSNISSKIAGNINDQVSGKLPSDVERLISQKSAERGVARGTRGSEFDKYGELRDLGLTSLEITDRGLNAAQRWMATVSSGAPTFNFTSMFLSPMQRMDITKWNKTMQWQRDWLGNQIRALPSNEEMAYAQMLDYVADFATMAAGVGVGSIGGGKAPAGGGGGGGGGAGYSQYADAALNASMSREPTIPQSFYNPPPSAPGPYYGPGYGPDYNHSYEMGGSMKPGGWGAP